MTAEFKQKFSDEAAATSYKNLTSGGFCEMKEGILMLLEQTPEKVSVPKVR